MVFVHTFAEFMEAIRPKGAVEVRMTLDTFIELENSVYVFSSSDRITILVEDGMEVYRYYYGELVETEHVSSVVLAYMEALSQ
jgi:hypothetical protein